MVYQAVDFGYGEVVQSADLNQLAENDRVFEEFRQDRLAPPHARVRMALSPGPLFNATWFPVPLTVPAVDTGGSRQPWTITTSGVRINEAGVYEVNLVGSSDVQGYTMRLMDTAPTVDVLLARQGSPSEGNTLFMKRRLPVGTTLQWQVHSVAPNRLLPDGTTTPCYLTITRAGN